MYIIHVQVHVHHTYTCTHTDVHHTYTHTVALSKTFPYCKCSTHVLCYLPQYACICL